MSGDDGEAKAGTEERILIAAIRLIERLGIERLTTRAIAAEAGVNLALVNYHYRSKAELARAALAHGLGNMLSDAEDFLSRPWVSRREELATVIEYLIAGSMNYPLFSKAILGCPRDYLAAGPSPAERLGSLVLEATRHLALEMGVRDEEAIALRATLIAGAIVLPIIDPSLVGAGIGGPFAGLALQEGGARRALAARLVEDAVADFERGAGRPGMPGDKEES